MWIENFQMYKLDLEKAEEPEIKLPTSTEGNLKKKKIEKARELKKKKVYFCFIDYAKTCGCVDHNKLWNILKEMEIPKHLICFLETCMNNGLVPNWERSMSRLYIVTLLI